MNRLLMAAALVLACGAPSFAQPRDAANDGQQPIQAHPGGPDGSPKSDQTVDAVKGTRLVLSNNAGEVVVRSWDQDKVRIQATHGGDIRVGLGGATNATVFVRTFQGDFTADFPIQLPDGQAARSGSKRFNFTLGNGSARIETQSFNGDIVLARKAIASKDDERQRRRGLSPMVAPPAPPAPPASPAPKPPKPPRWDESAWERSFKTAVGAAYCLQPRPKLVSIPGDSARTTGRRRVGRVVSAHRGAALVGKRETLADLCGPGRFA